MFCSPAQQGYMYEVFRYLMPTTLSYGTRGTSSYAFMHSGKNFGDIHTCPFAIFDNTEAKTFDKGITCLFHEKINPVVRENKKERWRESLIKMREMLFQWSIGYKHIILSELPFRSKVSDLMYPIYCVWNSIGLTKEEFKGVRDIINRSRTILPKLTDDEIRVCGLYADEVDTPHEEEVKPQS